MSNFFDTFKEEAIQDFKKRCVPIIIAFILLIIDFYLTDDPVDLVDKKDVYFTIASPTDCPYGIYSGDEFDTYVSVYGVINEYLQIPNLYSKNSQLVDYNEIPEAVFNSVVWSRNFESNMYISVIEIGEYRYIMLYDAMLDQLDIMKVPSKSGGSVDET